jgi:enoyl-CoA hydratase/carnithine racemase
MPDVSYRREDRVAYIGLQAASRGNAFTPAMRRELNQALVQYQGDKEAWMAVVYGEGANFCVGSAERPPASKREARERGRLWAGGYVEIWKPLIAAVQGQCKGEGLALALSCDLRVATENASFEADFGGPEGAPNVVPSWLVALLGLSEALELLWLRKTLDVWQAQKLGLVNRMVVQGQPDESELFNGTIRFPMVAMKPTVAVPDGKAVTGGARYARELLLYAPVTRNFQKETAYRSIGVPFLYAQSLEVGPNPYGSVDRIEGNRSFAENRRPVWQNR